MKTQLLRALLPIAIVFTLFSCSSDDSKDSVAAARKIVTVYDYNEIELKIISLVNEYRQSKGLNTLEVINHISYECEEHNYYMIENKVVNHDNFTKRSDELIALFDASKVGENIAYNYQSAESAVSAWKNSPGHRANMEGDFTHIGVSVTIDPDTGKKYYTNMFMKKK